MYTGDLNTKRDAIAALSDNSIASGVIVTSEKGRIYLVG